MKIKAAEAECESMRLQGLGVALQRKAIIEGLKDSMEAFTQNLPSIKPEEVMTLVMVTQYFDTLRAMGASNKSSTILLSPSPKGLSDIADQLREGIITANLASQ